MAQKTAAIAEGIHYLLRSNPERNLGHILVCSGHHLNVHARGSDSLVAKYLKAPCQILCSQRGSVAPAWVGISGRRGCAAQWPSTADLG